MTPNEHGIDVWSSDEWRAGAIAWIDERLAAVGLERSGAVEQPHLRPWSTVLEVPTSQGAVFFKATGPEVAFEAGLYELLERVAPQRILTPLGVDAERGWMLLPDGGLPLGERLGRDDLIDALTAALPLYAQVQRNLAPHAGEMLALGVADMRPEMMSRRFDEALEAMRKCIEHRDDPADDVAYERVAAMRETVLSWCDVLAGAPVAASIDHNDLHAWNILAGEQGGFADARFYDWGDGVVAHPFASMLALGFVPKASRAQVERMRDAYLEVFRDLGSRPELIETLELACRVGKIARALTWYRAIAALGFDGVDDRWISGPIESMASLLEDSYLGRA
jgi:Phosphotransferase enzyme family